MFPNLLSLATVLWDTVIEFYWRHYHIHKQVSLQELNQSKRLAGQQEMCPTPMISARRDGHVPWAGELAAAGRKRGCLWSAPHVCQSGTSTGVLEEEKRKMSPKRSPPK